MNQAYLCAILVLLLLAMSCEKSDDEALGLIPTRIPTNVPAYSKISSATPVNAPEAPNEPASLVLPPSPVIQTPLQPKVHVQLKNLPIYSRKSLTPASTPVHNTTSVPLTSPTPIQSPILFTTPPLASPEARPSPSPTPLAPTPLNSLNVESVFPQIYLERMVDLVFSNDDTERAFLVLQSGKIEVFDYSQDDPQPQEFLDIAEKVSTKGNEEGLLGMALSPNFPINGHFYLYYSATDPRRSIISRFSIKSGKINQADPESERIILEIAQPYSNHNGGQIRFGPKGFLYISLGDGGGGGDREGNGQNLTTLLGSILRIDVNSLDLLGTYSVPSDNPFTNLSNAKGEIWAYGLRNPWRFSFDSLTGDLWVGDVGQNLYEEINLVTRGGNYGWNITEGFHCYDDSDGNCDQTGLEDPVVEYGRDQGCSVTGGYVYRNDRLPELSGAYIYGDFCTGKIWALRHDGKETTEHMQIVDSALTISSFAQSPSGEIYILSFDKNIYRFVR